jgi:DNA-binding response OmpR family regulator
MVSLQRVNALIIDDDPEAVLLMGMRLNEACGPDQRFVLEGAETLSSGLAEIARGDFDVILLDLTLPDSRGLDTVKAVIPWAEGYRSWC